MVASRCGKNEITNTNSRVLWIDALRVISMLAVMTLHLTASGYKASEAGSFDWIFCYISCLFTRFAVPIFVMISGAMFLNPRKQLTVECIWKKYIKRLFLAFLFWSAVYAAFESLKDYSFSEYEYYWSFLKKLFEGHYHMWYVYMIMFLYMVTPFLKKITEEKKLLEIFILYAFLFGSCTELLGLFPYVGDTVSSIVHDMHCEAFAGYIGYYCLGYYLYNYELPKLLKKSIYILALIGFVLVAAFSAIWLDAQTSAEVLQSETLPFAVFMSVSVFLIFKKSGKYIEKSKIVSAVVSKVAPLSLGMYLVHPAINVVLRKVGLHAVSFNPVVCVPVCVLLVAIISFVIIWIMKKIPVVKKCV